MKKESEDVLFNLSIVDNNLLGTIQNELNEESFFLVTKEDVEVMVENRNKILVEKNIIDFSVEYLIKGAALFSDDSHLKKESWQSQITDFFNIFYEVRKETPLFIEDEIIYQRIKKLANVFEKDMVHVAGYFETNLTWYEEELDESFNSK
ncbi:DUF6323 family protein [Vagococcus carniphilus]|uniref:Uncharacterized protein n=1 Tax=Vagococcus carniphilus TaxID=218144 RepID=A0A430B6D9_9ENTE|nr:DUF6323 family protein [Vagococcus carniphilus]QNN72762.1 hypothetical protein H9L18_13010 [Vagococcus carniphilus]RSU15866.1 hypothetical protein CBF28_05375 [Vagococcus carniphilus]